MPMSAAEKLYRKSRKLPSQHSEADNGTTTIEESDTHKKLYWVVDKVVNLIPEEAKDHPLAKMLKAVARESKKDIRRIPEEYIGHLCNELSEMFDYVANGDISFIENGGNSSEEG